MIESKPVQPCCLTQFVSQANGVACRRGASARVHNAVGITRRTIAGGVPPTGTAIVQQLMAGKELGAESSDRNTARLPPGVHSPAPANLVGFLDAGTSLPGHGFSGTPPTETTGILPTPMPKPNPHFAGIALAGMPTQAIQSSQQSWLSAVAGVSYMRPVSQVNRSRCVHRLCGGLPRQTLPPSPPPFRRARWRKPLI